MLLVKVKITLKEPKPFCDIFSLFLSLNYNKIFVDTTEILDSFFNGTCEEKYDYHIVI